MSRITGSDAKALMEAYAAVYAPQELTEEQIWEEVESWVNSLLEEGYDLSDYTWEDMYEAYIEEQTFAQKVQAQKDAVRAQRLAAANPSPNDKAKQAQATARKIDAGEIIRTGTAGILNNLGLGRATALQRNKAGNLNVLPGSAGGLEKTIRLGGRSYDRLTTGDKVTYVRRGNTAAQPGGGGGGGGGEGGGGGGRNTLPPSKSDGPKVSSTKPAAPKQGTQAAGPASIKPKTPNPLLAGGDIRRMQQASQMRQKGINVTSNQLAAAERTKPATPTQATAAAPSTSAAASGSVAPATAKLAATPKPTPVAPKATGSKKPGSAFESYDAYDLVLEYLLDNGHVDTVDEAHYVMLEMDAETIGNIVEERRDPRGRPSSGPMNVYRNPKRKPDQAHLDAVKAYDEKQKQKSPEQRKKELDAYIERQRNR